MIPRSTCGLPMPGEDTGLEAVASPMAGYLGKAQERAASLDYCPWCSSNGLAYPLRSYRINLEESITLCTNPQCLFPLVSRPLEDVLTSLVPVEPATENKRKSPLTIEAQQTSTPSPKRLRLKEQDSPTLPTTTPSDVHNIVNSCNGQCIEGHRESFIGRPDAHQLKDKDAILGKELNATSCTDTQNVSITLETGIQDSSKTLTTDNQQVLSSQDDGVNEDHNYTCTVELNRDCSLPNRDVFPHKNTSSPEPTETRETPKPVLPAADASFLDIEVFQSEAELSSTETNIEKQLMPAPAEIFWRNVDNLCWLDSMLVALVNLKNLRMLKPKDDPEQSPMWTLLTGHDEACAAVQSHQQTDQDGCLKVPNHVLNKINRDFETHRMSVFNFLQPKLQCKLGQNESPVFALPLLVKMDSWLEPLFQSTFYWDFKCTKCKSSTKQSVVKTLPTFTNIVPDWHPLRAVHLAPCNNCHRKNQRRKMVLQEVSPVFALHFVEGLPDNNIQVYSFSFNKKHYTVTAVIQYNSLFKHFVTWAHRSDGSWVEFDDLKHPHCKSYKTLPVPAQEIHVVFWEEQEEHPQESRACSPSTTFTESPPSTNNIAESVTDSDILGEDLSQHSPDRTLLIPLNDSNIMDTTSEQDTTVTGADTSIGSTTLLEAFDGMTHNDIITLTLVDLNKDVTNPDDGQIKQANEYKSLDSNGEMHKVIEDTPAPDSSSTIGAKVKPKETDIEFSPVCDPEDNVSDDPKFEPISNKGQKKGRAAATASKEAKTTKVGNPNEKFASKVAENTPVCPVDNESTPAAKSKPTSPSSTTVSTLQNVSTKNVPQTPPVVEQQQKGWSQLLKRSLGHIQNTTSKCNSIQKPSLTSTPKPQTNAVPKPGLRQEEKGGLPLKAAEMYGAFGSKNSQKPLLGNTMLNNSINTSIEGLTSDTSLRKSKMSKMPPGLSETEALRYKLMKKLKAKKKKLAKLNEMLGQQGDASFKPDSTNINSPSTVTSSTLDDEFLSDLLSPATTITSTLSPDSTDFLEMLANGQEVTIAQEMPSDTVVQQSTLVETADLLDEFMSQAVAERPTEMEAEAFSALDLFL